jgi:hypothetical protein
MIRLKQLLFEDDDFMKSLIQKKYNEYISIIKKHDPRSIKDGFPVSIRPASAYIDFFNLFKDKRTGYNSFTAMVKGEFDAVRDKALLDQLSGLLKKAGIYNQRVPNGHIKIIRIDTGTVDAILNDVSEETKKEYNNYLIKARKWWVDWLNDPITKSKIIKNYNANKKPNEPVATEQWLNKTLYPIYFKVLYSLELRYHDPNKPDAKFKFTFDDMDSIMFVKPNIPATIFINILNIENDTTPLENMIHEIQHLLYYRWPMNSTATVLKIFKDKANNTITSPSVVNSNLQSISKKYQVGTDVLKWWEDARVKEEKKAPGYISDPNEKLSNITAIRKLFNLKPGQPITVAMMSPYIKLVKDNVNIYWLLLSWASENFPDLQQFLNDINNLAQTNDVNKTNSIEPNNQNIT